MSKRDPAFLFYSKDWLSGCQFMDMAERGMYITLIAAQHQSGRLDPKRVGFILGIGWDMVSDIVKSKFETDEAGLIFNERLELEVFKRGKYLEKQSINGKKGGRPKKNKTQTETQIKPNIYPNQNHLVNANVNGDIDSNSIRNKEGVSLFENETSSQLNTQKEKNDNSAAAKKSRRNGHYADDPDFMKFYEAYEKKVDPAAAYKSWKRLEMNDVLLNLILKSVEAYKRFQPDSKYRKNPATWLNQNSWESDYSQGAGSGAVVTSTNQKGEHVTSAPYKTFADIPALDGELEADYRVRAARIRARGEG